MNTQEVIETCERIRDLSMLSYDEHTALSLLLEHVKTLEAEFEAMREAVKSLDVQEAGAIQ